MTTRIDTDTHALGWWQRLWYSGPALDDLYMEHAVQRQIDTNAPVRSTVEIIIDAPPARVWAVLSDPEHWHLVDPRISHVHLDSGVAIGSTFTWRNGFARLRSRFAVVAPNSELTWTGRAMGANVVHRHVLEDLGDSRTRLTAIESMAGPLLILLYSSAKLHKNLEQWLAAISAAATS
ncbi:MAG TPA: SRPBCC family protein [Ilumatobacteraceae bacterium]|nr:SRPBCC family protein [Ilumatobacteraceae bacterium]